MKGGKRERGGGNGEKGERRGGVATEGQLVKQTESYVQTLLLPAATSTFSSSGQKSSASGMNRSQNGLKAPFPKKEFSSRKPCGGFGKQCLVTKTRESEKSSVLYTTLKEMKG